MTIRTRVVVQLRDTRWASAVDDNFIEKCNDGMLTVSGESGIVFIAAPGQWLTAWTEPAYNKSHLEVGKHGEQYEE